jgi:hypothetical protein
MPDEQRHLGHGYAFPQGFITNGGNSGGMTLRDYFAGQVLQGGIGVYRFGESKLFHDNHDLAKTCYQIADAMLKARGEK